MTDKEGLALGAELPEQGACYRHFKGKIYRVLAIARHTETLEELVVYEGLYGDHPVYARPLPMFAGRVDKEKYPDAGQEYRFERILEENVLQEKDEKKTEGQWISQMLSEFLELDSNKEKLEFLQKHRTEITGKELEAIAQSLDFAENSTDDSMRLLDIEKYLRVLIKYEGRRPY